MTKLYIGSLTDHECGEPSFCIYANKQEALKWCRKMKRTHHHTDVVSLAMVVFKGTHQEQLIASATHMAFYRPHAGAGGVDRASTPNSHRQPAPEELLYWGCDGQ